MKKVVIRGPVMTQSGYGVHSRQFVRYAMKRADWDVKFQVTPWGMTPWLIDVDQEVIKFITQRTTSCHNPDLSIQIQLPNEWDPSLARKNIGVTAAVESTYCNPMWVTKCNQMSSVIVPSSFTKKVLTDSGNVETTINVVNESYPKEVDECESFMELDIDTNFNLLIYGQITGMNAEIDRKNFFYCIKWLCELFKDDKDVGIIVKTNSGKNTKIDKEITGSLIKRLLKSVREGPYPKVHLLHGNLKDTEVAELYKNPTIEALVTATRGEGYGLPILEAAASDLPVIATNWSGHLDFLQYGKFVGLDYDLQEIPSEMVDNQIFMPGSRWAQVKEDDFKKKLKKFRSSSKVPKDWATQMGKIIREKFNQETIEAQIEKVCNGVLEC